MTPDFAMLILAPPSAESLFEGSSPLYVFIHSLHRSTQVTAIVRTGWSNPSKRDRPGGTSNNRRAATCKLGSWGATSTYLGFRALIWVNWLVFKSKVAIALAS